MKAILLLFSLCLSCEGANILVMLPLPLYSHTSAYMPIVKELARRRHNVTMVSPYPQEKPLPNLNDVVVPELYKEITDPTMFELRERNFFEDLKVFWDFGLRGSEAALKQSSVQKIISAPSDSFDLIITETFFLLEPMVALGHKFRCPVVNLQPWSMTFAVAYFTGNHLPSSYQPSVFTTYTDSMTFLQRTRNSLINAVELIGINLYYLPRQDAIMRKYLEGLPGFENLPHLSDLLRSTSLTLLDTHHALDYQKPYFRNVVEIGGLTMQNKQDVPKDLQKYMDESNNGFIYFSLGSHLSHEMLPESLKHNLFRTFSKLKENVIMKWDNAEEPAKPKNVMIEKWLPQREILAHPKCKLFITHGGLHGIQEATYHGIPLLGLPLVADQPNNMRLVQNIGIGISLNVFNTSEEILHDAISKIITDKKYKSTALERSSIMKDHPIGILDNAVFHLEYILRHKGAPHLRPTSLNRTWYELLLLDVVFLLASAVILSIITVVALMRFITLILGTKKKHKDKKN